MSALQPSPINVSTQPAGLTPGRDAREEPRNERIDDASNFKTPTTLFSDSPITPSKEYIKVVDPERKKLLFVLMLFVILTPLMFRYACGSSSDRDVSSRTIAWASAIDAWEWSVMIVLWLGILGSIMRLLPMVAGRPASIEASQACKLDGVAALGLCSPFSSEDDAILLRSLLGRTCTVFHTVGSRHSMQGLYLDTILNERRIKGEANRRNCWIAWMRFLNALIDVSLLMKEEAAAAKHGRDKSPVIQRPKDLPGSPSSPAVPYRSPQGKGTPEIRGILTPTPRASRSIADAASPPRQVTFRDVSTVFVDVSQSQRDRVLSWSRDPLARPLSTSMARASISLRRGGAPDRDSVGSYYRPMGNFPSQILEQPEEDDASSETSERTPSVISVGEVYDGGRYENRFGGGLDEPVDIAPPDISGENAFAYWFNIEREEGLGDSRDGFFIGGQSADFEFPTVYPGSGSDKHRSGRAERKHDGPNPIRSQQNLVTPPPAAPRRFSTFVKGLQVDTHRSSRLPAVDPIDMPAEAALDRKERGISFAIAPTKRARGITPRQSVVATSYLRPHGIPSLELNMADITPMIEFLDAWLDQMKQNEWTYDYHQPK
jgi:hypothetical protein